MYEKSEYGKIYRIKAAIAILVMLTLIFNSRALSEAIISGARLALLSVVPPLFPMFIISDFLCALPSTSKGGRADAIFERLFGINGEGIRAFVCGNICGFPIGASCSAEMLNSGTIDTDECERLIGICSCPSAAFVISGVGLAICGSIKDGIILYICSVLSAILCGIIHKRKRMFSSKTNVISRQSFIFSSSIKSAASRCVNVCAHISLFSAILSVTDLIFKNPMTRAFISIPIEMSNAAKRLSQIPLPSHHIRLALIGTAIGFSGICVLMQIKSVLPRTISMRKYTIMKIEQGMICGLLSLLCSIIFR